MEDSAKHKTHLEGLFEKLDSGFINASKGELYKIFVESIEKPLIEKALEHTFSNQSKAAKILGISRNTLKTKIDKFGIKLGQWKI